MTRLPLVLRGREFPIPVVLAPMAGVTNIPFRAQCRTFGPDLVYVSEMVMAVALVHGNERTKKMVAFGPDEDFRSLQIYGSDPDFVGKAVRALCEQDIADHIDMNFGCPATKVTRKGGGAAVPVPLNNPPHIANNLSVLSLPSKILFLTVMFAELSRVIAIFELITVLFSTNTL